MDWVFSHMDDPMPDAAAGAAAGPAAAQAVGPSGGVIGGWVGVEATQGWGHLRPRYNDWGLGGD